MFCAEIRDELLVLRIVDERKIRPSNLHAERRTALRLKGQGIGYGKGVHWHVQARLAVLLDKRHCGRPDEEHEQCVRFGSPHLGELARKVELSHWRIGFADILALKRAFGAIDMIEARLIVEPHEVYALETTVVQIA